MALEVVRVGLRVSVVRAGLDEDAAAAGQVALEEESGKATNGLSRVKVVMTEVSALKQ